MESSIDSDIVIKILLLGDSEVGKSCFLMRYSENVFIENYITTIGLDYKLKTIKLDTGKTIKVQLWDTAGQERFRTIAKSYYKGAHGIVLIYDVTNRKTYDNIRKWLNQIKDEASNKISIILVANKIDSEERQVSVEEGETLAKASNLPIFEASAKDSINVEESFKFLIEQINENIGDFTPTQTSTQLNSKNKSQKKGCC